MSSGRESRGVRLLGDGLLVFVLAVFASIAAALWGYDGNPVALGFFVFLWSMTLVATLRWHHDLDRKDW
jgi:hypothetical protein